MRGLPLILVLVCSWGCSGSPNGDSASLPEQYIRGDEKTQLVFEVDSAPGLALRDDVQSLVFDELEPILDKPDGIALTVDDELSTVGMDHAWSDAELVALADETFDLEVGDPVVKIHVLLVDGHHEDDSPDGTVLGIAWANRHVALFLDTIEAACESRLLPALRQLLCDRAVATIWLHETGHVIGLVDNGVPMIEPHRDEEHGAHDADEECVMYWTLEGESVIDLVRDRMQGGLSIPTFDSECLADIAAVRDADS